MFKNLKVIIAGVIFSWIIIAILSSWCEDIVFYLTNSKPVVSEISSNKIDLRKAPVQVDLPEFQKMFKFYKHHETFFIEPKAKYSISGRVLSTNFKFGMWGMRTDFDLVAPIDIVLAWQDVSDIKLYEKSIKRLHQVKSSNGGRYYYFYLSGDSIWSVSHVLSHTSHNHIIPANSNIMAILLKLKKYDVVKMTGYLVDIYKDGKAVAWTSLSRNDEDMTSRGYENAMPGGGCEVFFVKTVQVGDKIYK